MQTDTGTVAPPYGVPAYGNPCMGTGPTTIPEWKPPTPAPDSCSPNDIDAITTKFNDAMATMTDVYNAVSTTCQKCLFSDQTSASWQPLVWQPNMATGGGNAFVNFGACYAVAPGGSAACGKGVSDDQFCLDSVCSANCSGQGCVAAAQMGGCMTQANEVTTGCGSAQSALDATCGKLLDAINVVCGSGPADGGSSEGGTDSGTD
jgi:hypothetical protein